MLENVIQDPNSEKIYVEVPAPPLRIMALEGGGIRGLGYAELVEVLARLGLLEKIEHISGSSIGGIGALLITLGFTPAEIRQKMEKLPYASFLEGKDPSSYLQFFVAIFLKKKYYLVTGEKFRDWIEKVVEEKLGNKDATFADLAQKVEADGKHRFKYLHISESNASKNRSEMFDHEKTPDVKIVDAVMISIAYPTVFKPIVHQESTYFDGGVMNNLPVFTFNDRKYVPDGYDLNDRGANPGTLQIKVDNEDEMGLLWNNYKPKSFNSISEFGMAILYGLQSRDAELAELAPTNIIQVFDCNVATFKVNLSEAEKTLLLNSGRESMLEWLHNHVNEAYSVKTYENQRAWLASMSLNEIEAIKTHYFQELELVKTAPSTDATKKRRLQDKTLALSKFSMIYYELMNNVPLKIIELKKIRQKLFDKNPQDPEIKRFDEKLAMAPKQITKNFKNLAAFYDYDLKKIPITPHIDIKVPTPRKEIDDKIRADAKERLLFLIDKKNIVLKEIERVEHQLQSRMSQTQDAFAREHIVYLNTLKEELKLFNEVERTLLIVLNQQVPPLPPRAPYESLMIEMTQAYSDKGFLWRPHEQLITCFKSFLDKKTVAIKEGDDLLSLDIRNHHDFHIFILAALLYLHFVDSRHGIRQLMQNVFATCFPDGALPHSFALIKKISGFDGIDLQLFIYQVETLFKYFAALDRPKDKVKFQMINIDDVFRKLNDTKLTVENILSQFSNKKNLLPTHKNDVEMDFLYKPSAYTDKFLLFHSANYKDDIEVLDNEQNVQECKSSGLK